MKQAIAMTLAALGVSACLAMPALAQQRHVALILDNGAPTNAAATERLAQGLTQMRYRVIRGVQQDQQGMRRYVDQFRNALTDADVAMFFFSGVTLESGGRNLLMAPDVAPGQTLDAMSMPLDDVVGAMGGSQANFLFLDSGYADPRAERLVRSFAGVSPTLARIPDRARFMFAFANMPGKIARSDAESPFADALLAHLSNTDITSDDLSVMLRREVFARTRGSQLPWIRSQVSGVRLAALPDSPIPVLPPPAVTPQFDRTAMVRAVQQALLRHQCYSGTVNGDVAATNRALEELRRRRGRAEFRRIEVARANASDFEDWLRWIRAIEAPVCAPVEAPAAQPRRPRERPIARVPEQIEEPARPRRSTPRPETVEPPASRQAPTRRAERFEEDARPRSQPRERDFSPPVERRSAPSFTPSAPVSRDSGGFSPFAPTR